MVTRVLLIGPRAVALRERLEALPASFDIALDTAGVTELPAAQRALTSHHADVAIVPADLGDAPGSGLDLVAAVPPTDRPVAVLVVSTREDDAVRAFELEATDFLLEPVSPERLQAAMARARQAVLQRALFRTAEELQRLLVEATSHGLPAPGTAPGPRVNGHGAGNGTGNATANGNGAGGHDGARTARSNGEAATAPDAGRQRGGLRSILVREGRRTRFVPLSEIDWFEADGNYIVVHSGGQRYRTRGTINGIEAGLDPRQFARIHRRVVVNMDRVRELSPLPGGDGLLRLGGGATLRLSRTYRARVR
jgi:two-component system LytT family response regulator